MLTSSNFGRKSSGLDWRRICTRGSRFLMILPKTVSISLSGFLVSDTCVSIAFTLIVLSLLKHPPRLTLVSETRISVIILTAQPLEKQKLRSFSSFNQDSEWREGSAMQVRTRLAKQPTYKSHPKTYKIGDDNKAFFHNLEDIRVRLCNMGPPLLETKQSGLDIYCQSSTCIRIANTLTEKEITLDPQLKLFPKTIQGRVNLYHSMI